MKEVEKIEMIIYKTEKKIDDLKTRLMTNA